MTTTVVPITREALADAGCRVLAEYAFFIAEAGEGAARPRCSVVEAVLPYDANTPGELVLRTPAAQARELAQAILGSTITVTDDVARDGIGEFLNVLAGVVLDEAFGADGSYRLGLPRTSVAAWTEPPPGAAAAVLRIEDGAWMEIEVREPTAVMEGRKP